MDSYIRVEITFGTVDVESRWHPEGRDFVGMSRRVVRDRFGCVTEIAPWERTGARLVHPPELPKRTWWQRITGLLDAC